MECHHVQGPHAEIRAWLHQPCIHVAHNALHLPVLHAPGQQRANSAMPLGHGLEHRREDEIEGLRVKHPLLSQRARVRVVERPQPRHKGQLGIQKLRDQPAAPWKNKKKKEASNEEEDEEVMKRKQ